MRKKICYFKICSQKDSLFFFFFCTSTLSLSNNNNYLINKVIFHFLCGVSGSSWKTADCLDGCKAIAVGSELVVHTTLESQIQGLCSMSHSVKL